MNADNILSQPQFQNLSREKKEFIKTVLLRSEVNNPNQAMKVFMDLMTESKKRNIQFEHSESALLISVLKSTLDEEGQKKVERILKMTGFH